MVEGSLGSDEPWIWHRSIVSEVTVAEIAGAFEGKLTLSNTKFRGTADSTPRDGEICVIPKDITPTLPGAKTYMERVKNIEDAWSSAKGSSKIQGCTAANQFRDGKKIALCNSTFGQIMVEELPGIVVLSSEDGDDSTTSWSITAHADYVRSAPLQLREKLVFWLRWNEWKKFEAVVVTNTDLENHPTEWDSAYGLYWRAVNKKELRFDEVYEVCDGVDKNLRTATKNNGKLMRIF
jgi:hypothetical protein